MDMTIYEQLADFELRIADCEAQLEGNTKTRFRDREWEQRCRFSLLRLVRQRDALLKVIERAEAHVCSC